MEIKELLDRIRTAKDALESAGPLAAFLDGTVKALDVGGHAGESVRSSDDLKALDVELFGKKGLVSLMRKRIPQEAEGDRKEAGRLLNELAGRYRTALDTVGERLLALEREERLAAGRLDVTLPGRRNELGRSHP